MQLPVLYLRLSFLTTEGLLLPRCADYLIFALFTAENEPVIVLPSTVL